MNFFLHLVRLENTNGTGRAMETAALKEHVSKIKINALFIRQPAMGKISP